MSRGTRPRAKPATTHGARPAAKLARPIEILPVEDNPGDVRLTAEALHEARVLNELRVVVDGEQAMAFLRRTGAFADAPRAPT